METKLKTHCKASGKLIGNIIELEEGYSKVKLVTTEEMSVDVYGLIHGGFIFGLADYAAMVAVNKPTVVLGKAEVRFVNPVRAGEELTAQARVEGMSDDYKKTVKVEITDSKNKKVFEGDFHCYVLKKHVLA